MADHIHEWAWKPWYEVRKFVCTAKDCNAIMTMAEAERRLNAVDEFVWLLRNEPPDDLGAMTYVARLTWSTRRNAAFAALESEHESS